MKNESFVKLYDKDELRNAWINYSTAKELYIDFLVEATDKWLHWTLFHHGPIYYFFNKKKDAYLLFKSKMPIRYSDLLCRTINRDQIIFVDEMQFGVWDDLADEAKKILRVDCEEVYATSSLLGFIDKWKMWDSSVLEIEAWDQKR